MAVSFEGEALSYRELDARSNHLAHHLMGHGVVRDTPVAIYMERSLDLFVAILGVLKAGGAYVPVDPAYPEERVRLILEDCGAPVVLTQERLLKRLPELPARRVAIETVPEVPGYQAHAPPLSSENLAYLMYTSGSTGRPKGVAMTHAALLNLIEWQDAALPLRASGRVLQFSALSFDVSFQEMFSTWRAGGEMIAIPEETRRDPDALVRFIDEQCIERVFLPYVALQMLASASCRKAIYPSGLRDVVTAGERLRITPEIRQMFSRIADSRLHNHYGPSETHVVTSYTLEGSPEGWPSLPPIGRGISGACIYLLDPGHREVPVEVVGELTVGGAALARGYWYRPELTREKFIDDPFCAVPGARLYKTGDMARRLANGTIEFLGRADDQVKIRGFRIELGEIEAVLGQHPRVRECSVLARADERGNKRLIAYVMAHGQITTLKTEMRAFLQSRLPDYMVPAAFVVMDLMPLTPNGKVDRKALPAPEFTDEENGYVAPGTFAEERITAIWAAVLNRSRVGVKDDFFALGGDSLLATQIVSRVRDAFQVEVPLRWLFEASTVADLAERVTALDRRAEGRERPARVLHEGPLPLSFAQRRLWFLDLLEPLTSQYNLPYIARLRGRIHVGTLERSLNAILQRHEALRTRFDFVDGTPAQLVDPWQHSPLPVVELSALAVPERESELRRLIGEEAVRPFDLTTGPLFRACLIQLAEDDRVLLLNTHHIVNDGWSLGILVREMSAFYGAFLAGQPSPLPELPLQYADFTIWQCRHLTGSVLETQLSYWMRHLEGAPTLLDLPADRPRPIERSSRSATEEVVFPEPLLRRLKALSRQEGATLYTTLLAAFQVLLGRYSGQRDFTVGMPIAGRNHVETEGLIGFFVNMLILRCDLSGNPAFRGLLRRVRETVLGAHACQDLPLERLMEELRPKRHSSYRPLCQVVFGMQDPPGSAKLGEVDLTLEAVPSGTSEFDLSIHMSEETGGLRTVAEYSTELFDRETILTLLENFRTLLGGIAANPDEAIGNLPLLSQGEQRKLLVEWNATQVPYPRSQCIHQLFEQQAERTPDAVVVVFSDR
ncbi:MAG TPA: amino acid adenylation domain-containing protein, partial [Candidatus Solibacter sp.]